MLYHGSIYDFDKIDISKGKGYKDFGKGFYATAVARHAEKQLIGELKPENLPKQYFFGTEKAVKTLRFDIVRRNIIE